MRNFVSSLLVLFLFSVVTPAHAADAPAALASPVAARPRIALVLSGGGARGYSHIGVLKVLEALRVPVDIVVGTSMGAVVGGLYATGLSADELERKVTSVNLGDVAFDRVSRTALPQTLREDEQDYPISLPFGFDDSGTVKLPKGFVRANHFLALLQEWTASVPPNRSFDQLPLPFRAVATDLESGQRVVFDHGSLPVAIRASMAAPGLFSPIEVNGRMLIDGGIVDNLPVDVARETGADIVIAVHIGTPLRKSANIGSPADVAQQMVGILIGQNVKAQKDSLHATDVLISPDLGDIKFTDFTRASEAISAGERAAEALRDRLSALSMSEQDYAAYRAEHRETPTRAPARIDKIEIDSAGRVPPAFVQRYLGVEEGDAYDAHEINERLAALQTTGYFEGVSHEFIDDGDGVHRLRVNAAEKSWGPNFLLFGVGLSTDFDGGGGFEINIGHRRPWITSAGLEWRNDFSLGDEKQSFRTELRQPIFAGYGYYLAPYAGVSQTLVNYYDVPSGSVRGQQPALRTWRREAKAGLDFAVPLGHLGEVRVGVATSRIWETPNQNILLVSDGEATTMPLGSQSWSQSYARAQLVIDQLDDALFPRSGYLIRADAQSPLGLGDSAYQYLHASATGAASIGRHSVNATVEAGTSRNSGAPFTLGGFRHLAAYGVNQFSGNYLFYSQLTYQFRVASPNGQAVRDLYLGATGEAGNATLTREALTFGQLRKSFSVFVGATTALGPAYLGYAIAPGGAQSVYLQFGAKF